MDNLNIINMSMRIITTYSIQFTWMCIMSTFLNVFVRKGVCVRACVCMIMWSCAQIPNVWFTECQITSQYAIELHLWL
jgi:hypothetical protein